jgi:hypothetical protein
MVRWVTTFAAVLVLATTASCAKQEARPQSAVKFVREHVRVEPADGRTRVVGIYSFRNDSDSACGVGMRYPFPIDRGHLYPMLIRVCEERSGGTEPMGFVHEEAGVAWQLRFAPREEKVVRVEYVQEIREKRAIYIVTTTRQWMRPIDVAEFEFRVPASLEGVRLSFEPDCSEAVGDTTVFRMTRREFMPDSDLTVTWE